MKVDKLKELFISYGKQPDAEVVKVYLKHLADLDDQDFSDAVDTIIREGTHPYFPRINELRDVARRIESVRPMPVPDYWAAMMAWNGGEDGYAERWPDIFEYIRSEIEQPA